MNKLVGSFDSPVDVVRSDVLLVATLQYRSSIEIGGFRNFETEYVFSFLTAPKLRYGSHSATQAYCILQVKRGLPEEALTGLELQLVRERQVRLKRQFHTPLSPACNRSGKVCSYPLDKFAAFLINGHVIGSSVLRDVPASSLTRIEFNILEFDDINLHTVITTKVSNLWAGEIDVASTVSATDSADNKLQTSSAGREQSKRQQLLADATSFGDDFCFSAKPVSQQPAGAGEGFDATALLDLDNAAHTIEATAEVLVDNRFEGIPMGDLELTSNSDLTKQLCREFARPDPGGVIDIVLPVARARRWRIPAALLRRTARRLNKHASSNPKPSPNRSQQPSPTMTTRHQVIQGKTTSRQTVTQRQPWNFTRRLPMQQKTT